MTCFRQLFDREDTMATTLSPLATRLLLGGWLCQLLLSAVIALVAPIPVRPLVMERRVCSDSQLNAMVDRYRALVLRDRLGIERFRPARRGRATVWSKRSWRIFTPMPWCSAACRGREGPHRG
jgi:hypothetical protein